jgi:hypothetical protein
MIVIVYWYRYRTVTGMLFVVVDVGKTTVGGQTLLVRRNNRELIHYKSERYISIVYKAKRK